MAGAYGHKKVAQLLLQNGAQPDIQRKVCILGLVKFTIISAVFNAQYHSLIVFVNLTGHHHPSHNG